MLNFCGIFFEFMRLCKQWLENEQAGRRVSGDELNLVREAQSEQLLNKMAR